MQNKLIPINNGVAQPTAETDQGKCKILIIDDETAILESLKDILERQGNSVHTAGTGAEAVKMLEAFTYDIIICDMKLPDINPVDFYRQIKNADAILPKTIFISGDMKHEKTKLFLNTSRAHYLVKPFRPRELFQKIKEITANSVCSDSAA